MPHHLPTPGGRILAAGAAGVLALGLLATGSPAVARPHDSATHDASHATHDATHASHLGTTGHTKAGHHKRGKHHPARPSQHVLATGLLSPLRAAVAADGTAYVSENFAGTIDRIDRHGTTTVYTDPDGYEVGGLSLSGRNLVFTVTQSVGEGENLEVDPPRRLVQTMLAHFSPESEAEGHSRVTWEIEQVQDSCRLTVTHDQMREGACEELYGGWPMILSGLKTWLEVGDVLTTPGSLLYS